MPATCVLWYVPRGNTGLSKHGDPVFPHLCPQNQNLAHIGTGGGCLWQKGGTLPVADEHPSSVLPVRACALP